MASTPRATQAEPAIRLSTVSKTMSQDGRSLHVLDNIELFAANGEFVSIIGPSGCGKSTILNIIAGLDEPSAGTVYLNGDAAAGRLGAVGYMHQKDLLMPWRTALDNAILGLEIRGVSRRDARTKAMDLADRFGLRGFENAYPYALSGGMRQRTAFLRTVLAGQSVFLLDEPFSALDALTRTQLQDWLLGLWEQLRKTVVLVTHDVDEAIFLSDRIYVMTPRPGRMKLVERVPLPRPRTRAMVTEAEFVRLKKKLMAALL